MIKNISDNHLIHTHHYDDVDESDDKHGNHIITRKKRAAIDPDNYLEITIPVCFYNLYEKTNILKASVAAIDSEVKQQSHKTASGENILKKRSGHISLKTTYQLIKKGSNEEKQPAMGKVLNQALMTNSEQMNEVFHHPRESVFGKQWPADELAITPLLIAIDTSQSRSPPGKNRAENNQVPQLPLPTLSHQSGMDKTRNVINQKEADRSVNIHYQFQQWTGEHSVMVSIPAAAKREGALTLLPSDSRAAEMLARQIHQLSGFSPQLLHPYRDPYQEGEGHHRPQHNDNQEEDVE